MEDLFSNPGFTAVLAALVVGGIGLWGQIIAARSATRREESVVAFKQASEWAKRDFESTRDVRKAMGHTGITLPRNPYIDVALYHRWIMHLLEKGEPHPDAVSFEEERKKKVKGRQPGA